MKRNIRFYRSLSELYRDSLEWFLLATRLERDVIFKLKDKPIGAIGMRFAGNASCQKFWIG